MPFFGRKSLRFARAPYDPKWSLLFSIVVPVKSPQTPFFHEAAV